jgi:hypothetical protein
MEKRKKSNPSFVRGAFLNIVTCCCLRVQLEALALQRGPRASSCAAGMAVKSCSHVRLRNWRMTHACKNPISFGKTAGSTTMAIARSVR